MSLLCATADARHLPLPDNSVQCVVTSPPYWGLRKYAGEQVIKEWDCAYGLEPTIEMYVAHTVEILREIRRVLRPDGVCFFNIGDSYSAQKGYSGDLKPSDLQSSNRGSLRGANSFLPHRNPQSNLKPKDMVLMPARVALAAQADGWWVRSDIIWAKPNPMPESVTDRPTDSYEHIFMFTKSERYYWHAEAVKEPAATEDTRRPYGSEGMWQMDGRPVEQRQGGKPRAHARGNGVNPKAKAWKTPDGWDTSKGEGGHGTIHKEGREKGQIRPKQNESFSAAINGLVTTRNMRNVWGFATQGFSGAHFATFPEELPRRCIMAGTKPGDIVLDPFAGSGTTGRVAIELNRSAILFDLAYNAEYAELARKRTTNVQRQLIASA